MLNTTTIRRQSVGKVVNYYSDGADDYYSKDGAGHKWLGTASEDFELNGQSVDKKDFGRLLDGEIDDNTRMRRFTTDASKERLAVDLTFTAPKTVSMQALIHGDERIIQAHEKAVAAAVAEAEKFAAARVTKDGKTSVEMTGNLAVATFRHETSREQEPHLHTHAVVMNMTKRSDGEYRALMNDYIFKNATHISHTYNAELSRELEKMGFEIRYDKNGAFDLAHISEAQKEAFSSRRAQIDAALEAKGLSREESTVEQRNDAALATRAYKRTTSREELHQEWKKTAQEIGVDFESRQKAAGKEGQTYSEAAPREFRMTSQDHAADAIQFAIRSQTERQTTVTESTLLNAAAVHGMGKASTKEIRQQFEKAINTGSLVRGEAVYASVNMKNDDGKPVVMTRSQWIENTKETLKKTQAEAERMVDTGITKGRLTQTERLYTTAEARDRERSILDMEQRGRGLVRTGIEKEAIDAALRAREEKGIGKLSVEQDAAVRSIVQAENRFVGVHGFAGTGKSFQTKAAQEILEGHGFKVEALAPYSGQKQALEQEGLHARTVASFLHAKDKKIDENTVLLIDEAGVIPAKDMQQIMSIVETNGARAVFMGDTGQTKAIQAGKPLDQLIAHGMATAHVSEIQRQKSNPELLKAVQFAAEGKVPSSLETVEKKISVIPDKTARHAQIAKEFAELEPATREKTIIVTGTNESRKEINALVRQQLGTEGKGEQMPMLVRVDTTQAERSHARYYTTGQIIVPEQSYPKLGLIKGEKYTVTEIGTENKLTVKNAAGDESSFSPYRKNLSVYQKEMAEVAVGDRMRLTRNINEKQLANGQQMTVEAITEQSVVMKTKDGQSLTMSKTDPQYVSLAYATTVHSSQGMTADRAILNLDTGSRTTTKEVYYVGLSRAKYEASIYTDDRKALPKAASRETEKTAALELTPDARSRKAMERADERAMSKAETHQTVVSRDAIDRANDRADRAEHHGQKQDHDIDRANAQERSAEQKDASAETWVERLRETIARDRAEREVSQTHEKGAEKGAKKERGIEAGI